MQLGVLCLQRDNIGKFGNARPLDCLCCRFMQNDTALMGGAAWATWGFLDRALSGGMSGYMANAVATMGGIAAGVAVYFILVIALRILRAEDVKNIKKGDAIIRILHLK